MPDKPNAEIANATVNTVNWFRATLVEREEAADFITAALAALVLPVAP